MLPARSRATRRPDLESLSNCQRQFRSMLQLMRTSFPMRLRLLIAAAIGLASGTFCWFLLAHFHQGAADFGWAVRAAQYWLAGKNPYDTPLEQYPLTAA